ncbi:MAG: O-antigen ligase family protein [Ruminococcus sp.]|nr:O-antigen ligase family protein [Ruminococcus sp.]
MKIESKSNYNMRNSIVSYYLLLMFTVFELFLSNQYVHARTDKFILFIVLTSLLIVSVGIISLSYVLDKNAPIEHRVVEHKPIFSFSVTDYAFFLFFLFAVITTLVSEYKLDSLTGGAGRDNGLVLLALYTAMYFIVSRFYYYKEYVLAFFLVAGCIISGLAILHFFYIDPLGIMTGYSDNIVNDFGTTIGNKNTIASYMCIFLPVCLMMFITYKSRNMMILSAVALCFAYCGLLSAGSNSGYIGFFAMLFFMMLICVKSARLFRKFMLALAIMFFSGKVLRVFSFFLNDKSKGFEAIGKKLVYGNEVFLIIIICAVISLLMYKAKDKKDLESIWPKNILTAIVLILGSLVLIVCGYMFYKYTFIDTTTDIGSLSQYFRFDDRWGTHRGFMWINGVKDFLNFDAVHILFGSGCDTFYHVFEPHFAELSDRFNNSSTDCIHSEYLNYLVTQGILGLSAYLGIIVTTIYRALKTSKENILSLVFVMPVITYAAQSIVNIYQPITTPFFFIFIALCECLSRKSNPVNKIN